MSTTSNHRHLPLSVPNIVVIGASFAGAVTTIVLGNWFGAAVLIMLGGGGLLSALLARRAGASDWLRINAIEYRDERDSRLASHGFAVVGAWALALATLELVGATIFAGAVITSNTVNGSGADFSVTFTRSSILAVAVE